jgi:hypothetical protein
MALTSNLVKNNECDVTYVVQCHDVIPNASFTGHDVSHCSVEEVKIVMFINQKLSMFPSEF